MSDWEIWAPTEEQLTALAKSLLNNKKVGSTSISGPNGYLIEGFLTDDTRFSICYYKIKLIPTGNMVDDGYGGTMPEMKPAPGVFAIMRWLSPTDHDPPQPNPSSGVTLKPLPDDSPCKFAA